MATIAHTIYSHYSPEDRERLERETGQHTDGTDPWQIESSAAAQRRKHPPRFIPASSHDLNPTLNTLPPPATRSGTDVASWYRSVPRSDNTSSSPIHSEPSKPAIRVPSEQRTKNNWFIMNSIETPLKPSPTPTLADILERDPPPPPSAPPFQPPVWLTLGPSNKGFSMLERKGWNEGEPLGPSIPRPPVRIPIHNTKTEQIDGVETIDLTLSSGSEDEGDDFPTSLAPVPVPVPSNPDPHAPRALLTPLPTVLKSDRLGLGLKAKTFINPDGFRESQKRVTHNAAALAKHIRDAEEARKTRDQMGRGTRRVQKASRLEARKRKEMLAYLNS